MGSNTSDPRLSSPSTIKIKSNLAVPSTFIDGGAPSLTEVGTVPTTTANANGSGKPRVHVCATCQRSFGRLEHVKRHERSHTKEKPFECEKCTRRFSRRDLLRRHQQNVHQMLNPTSHLYKRRESTSAVTPGQNIRKSNGADINSARFCSTTPLRLLAYTVSDVDSATTSVPASVDALNRNPNLAGLPAYTLDHDFGDLPAVGGKSSIQYGLPILETEQTGHSDFDSINLRTSPLNPELGAEGVCVKLGSTISPGEIHFNTSPQLMFIDQAPPFRQNSNDVALAQEFSESWTG